MGKAQVAVAQSDTHSWQVEPWGRHAIGIFGKAEVDLFASEDNSHCPTFFSKQTDALAQAPPLCFSPDHNDPLRDQTNQGGQTQSPAGGPTLEDPNPVLRAVQALHERPMAYPPEKRPPLSGERDNLAPPAPAVGSAPMVPRWEPLSLPRNILHTISQARALSTRRLYAQKWSVFVVWCSTRNVDPVENDVSQILSFLQEWLDSGLTPSTLKVYVAAIGAFYAPTAGQTVGRNGLVVPLKGPPFEPLQSADLRPLTLKTTLLLALASVKRISDLQALSRPGYFPLSATSFHGRARGMHLLCPVRALRIYAERSQPFRQSDQLFICFGGRTKGSPVSKQRLSRWIVDAIALCYSSMGLDCPIRCEKTASLSTVITRSQGPPSPSVQEFHSNKDITGSQAELNVSAAAQSGSNITAPALTKNTITGNVHIIHNAPGFTGYYRYSEKTQTSEISSAIHKYKKLICSEYQYVTEYNSLPGEHVLLSECYTQPLILKKHRDPNEREEEICSRGESFHEVLSSRSSENSVHLNSLFDPDGHGISPRAVILQGNSGNGKTFTVQKIMMDWASGDLYKERFDIVFHLKCKEINRIPDKNSLAKILSYSCSLTPDQISQMLQHSPEKVLFIIDGFDELRLTQDIYHTSSNSDPLQKAPPVAILCDLLRGRILPESFLLVTSRSTATDKLSELLKGPQSFSEIIGFSQEGVEEYFQKFFQNKELFRKAYTFVKANETLITVCSIPIVCWIICTTIQERFKIGADITRRLETTTSIYVDFVSTLLEHHCQGLSQSVPTLLRSLGQLAERGMLEEQVLFDERSVNETVSDPACSPFLCKFLFKRRIHQETMFSFMHLSFQEFFTALYYVLLDEEESQRKFTQLFSIHEEAGGFSRGISRLTAVVQFAFGLLNKDVRDTLGKKHGLFVHPNTQAYLKKMILTEIQKESWDSYTICFWIHCLYELHEEDFVKKAMESTPHITMYGSFILRRIDCWALLYCSQCCECIESLALHDCRLSSEKLSIILPALCKFKNLM
ncbi:NACHT, LRR and PYD domains-containing protein 1 homolog [Chanodichthys erythropterus]|uniref:NACHT, LRR and PYD domains-containing protein 1 homolog n=1 Tax=Chanodichthys erythropterus TaxID=933992 RepID=UPI00351DEE92